MELFFGITLLAASFLLGVLISLFRKETEDDTVVPSAVVGALLMVFLIAGIHIMDEYFYPSITPMDVYHGKTTLEITYRDSVAIDSVVVWKEEVK